jgi:hypothetical protein
LEAAGFSKFTLWLAPGGWEYYLPRPVRFIARVHDRFVAPRRKNGNLILIGLLSVD